MPMPFDLDCLGAWTPWILLILFFTGSFLMIWRLEAMTRRGVEGTVLGTLVMPYCSGMGNLVFVFVVGRSQGPGQEVMINCLVNNVTNLTLLIGLPALFWGMRVLPAKKRVRKREAQRHRINRLSLLLTMTAVAFFSGAVWALAQDGTLEFGDGLVLIGIFVFWQFFHVFEVLKSNVREGKTLSWILLLDFAILGLGTYDLYISVEGLVSWISRIETGFFSAGIGASSGRGALPATLLINCRAFITREEVVRTMVGFRQLGQTCCFLTRLQME